MNIRFFGDVHACFDRYINDASEVDFSIQVGDFGIGFETDKNPIPILNPNHRFIRGNHDNPSKCYGHPNWIADGHYDETTGIFFVGGAESTDKNNRVEGYDWWRDEELTIVQINTIIDDYERIRPSVVVSHDCPTHSFYFPEFSSNTRTRRALDAMFEIHAPKLWVHGHHHQSIDRIVNNTRFVCVDKNSYVDIDI